MRNILVYWLSPTNQLYLYCVWVSIWCLRYVSHDIYN